MLPASKINTTNEQVLLKQEEKERESTQLVQYFGSLWWNDVTSNIIGMVWLYLLPIQWGASLGSLVRTLPATVPARRGRGVESSLSTIDCGRYMRFNTITEFNNRLGNTAKFSRQ
jgi:hypothetical protein